MTAPGIQSRVGQVLTVGSAYHHIANATERFLGTSRGNPVAFARTAFAAGATAVFGHGPHVMRAAEWRGEQLVFYSLGNLLTYGPFRNREPQDRGAVACVVVEAPRKITAAELRPTRQLMAGALTGDSTGRALTLVDSLSALDFPRTGVTVAPDGTIGRRDAAVIRANPPRRR